MMAYNNGFPATYQPMYYAPQYQPQQPMAQPQAQQQMSQPMPQPAQMAQPVSNSLIWVQGEAGAKSYLVAPNTTVPLWDSEAQRIFLKTTDAAGMPSMKILTYTIEEAPSIGAPAQRAVNAVSTARNSGQGFVSDELKKALEGEIQAVRSDLDAIRSEMETFRGDLYGIAGKKTGSATAAKKKEVSGDE